MPACSRMLTLIIASTLAATLSACVTKSRCANGTIERDGECMCPDGRPLVPIGGGRGECPRDDAGPGDAGGDLGDLGDSAAGDLGADAPMTDAGPCGMACPAATPVCDVSSGTCVQCNAADDSECSGATPVCDTAAASATRNRCVACNVDSDCTSLTAPQCNTTHACVPCTASAACTGRAAATVCDVAGGACVRCTGADRTACALNVCDVEARTCSTSAVNSANLCEPCVSDVQCQTGQVCVGMSGDTPTRVLGHFCLWLEAATGTGAPAGDCLATRPYRQGADRTALEAGSVRVCEPRIATCEALLDFDSSTTPCTPAAPAIPNDACGAIDVDDGYCQLVSGVTNRCTVACTSFEDCPDPLGAARYRCTAGLCSFTTGTESGGACL